MAARRALSALMVVSSLALAAPAAEAAPGFDYLARVAQPPGPNSGSKTPEIIDVTPDGATLFSTLGERGFAQYDVSDPEHAEFVRVVGVGAGRYVSSVNVRPDGRYLVVTTKGRAEGTSSTVTAYALPSLDPVRQIRLGAQPDTSTFTPDGSRLLVPIEDEPDVQLQGTVEVIGTSGPPSEWTRQVVTIPDDPDMLNPEDVQPEFIDVTPDGSTAAITLQENNAVAILDLDALTVTDVWSAGRVAHLGDMQADGTIAFEDLVRDDGDPLLSAPREPDELAFTPDGQHLVLANEGEGGRGGRSFTVHALDGRVEYDGGPVFERALAEHGLYDDGRSSSKGAEPEGVDVGTYGGRDYAFVGAERADALVAVDVTDPTAPSIAQVIPTGGEPEGLLVAPQRGLVYTADAGNPRGFSIIRFGDRDRSADDDRPVRAPGGPYSGIAGLGAAPGGRLAALTEGPRAHIVTLDPRRPDGTATAVADVALTLPGGDPAAVAGDAGDVAADPAGGWWVAARSDGENVLWHVDAAGEATAVPGLPDTGSGSWAGVATSPDGATVYVGVSAAGAPGEVIALDVASGTTRLLRRPALGLTADIAVAPDGALVILDLSWEFGDASARLLRAEVDGLPDGATFTPELVTGVTPPSRTVGSEGRPTSLAVTRAGDAWTISKPPLLTHRGRLFTRGGGAEPAPALGLPSDDAALGLDRRPTGTIEQLLRDGRTVFALGGQGTALTNPAPGLGALATAGGLPDAAWPGVAGGEVLALAGDGDGGAFVAGTFTAIGGVARAGLAHVLADGTVDGAWAPTITGTPRALVRDGATVWVGGDLSAVGGTPRGGLAALSASDGALLGAVPDPAFTGGGVSALGLDDGTLYAAGDFTGAGGQPHARLARLDAATGAVDHGWTPTLTAADVRVLQPLGDRVFVGGRNLAVGGTSVGAIASVRSDDAGTLDTGFAIGGLEQTYYTVAGLAAAGGRLYVSADGTANQAPSGASVVAVDPADGTVDQEFAPAGLSGPGGPLAVAGEVLWVTGFYGVVAPYDAETGASDTAFTGQLSTNGSGYAPVAALAVEDDRVVVGGGFDSAGILRPTFAFDAESLRVDLGWSLRQGERAVRAAVAGDWLYYVSSLDGRVHRADLGDGSVDGDFALDLGGDVQLAGDDERLYVGGAFEAVGEIGRRNLAAFDARTGELVDDFRPNPFERVTRVALAGARLYVATVQEIGDDEDLQTSLSAYDAGSGARVEAFAPAAPAPRAVAEDLAVAGAEVALALRIEDPTGETMGVGEVMRIAAATGAALPAAGPVADAFPETLLHHGGALLVGGAALPGALVALDAAGARSNAFAPAFEWSPLDLLQRGTRLFVAGGSHPGPIPGPIAVFDTAAPVSATPPQLSGRARQGGTLACTPGTWDNAPTRLAYAWTVDDAPVAGAEEATFALREEDRGKAVRCRVTAANEAGETDVASAPATIGAGAPLPDAQPQLTGAAREGETLTCTTGTWKRDPTGYEQRWLRDGETIDGATGATYAPGAADVGHQLACRVTAVNDGGASVPALSAPVTVLARLIGDPPPPDPPTRPNDPGPPPVATPDPPPTQDPPPAPDRVAPKMRIVSLRPAARADGLVNVRLSCPRGESACRGTVALRLGRRALASARLSVRGGRTVVVALRLGAAERRALRRDGRIAAQLVVSATDAAGNSSRTTTRVTVVRGRG